MPMDSEMNDISLSDFTPYTIVASPEMSDEPDLSIYRNFTHKIFIFCYLSIDAPLPSLWSYSQPPFQSSLYSL